MALYDNALTGDYTCPDNITVCQISCANVTDQCRSQVVGVLPELPSSSAPTGGTVVHSTPLPSMNVLSPPSIVDTDPETAPPTPTASVVPPSIPPPTPTIQTYRPTTMSVPRPVPSAPFTDPPTQRPTQTPFSIPGNLPTDNPAPAPSTVQTNSPEDDSRVPICRDGIVESWRRM